MRKILVLSILVFSFVSSVNAEQLVLSDRIQQALDAQRMQMAKEKAELAMMKPACTNNCGKANAQNTQTAEEKLNIRPDKNMQ